jgi:hypothetical protein
MSIAWVLFFLMADHMERMPVWFESQKTCMQVGEVIQKASILRIDFECLYIGEIK